MELLNSGSVLRFGFGGAAKFYFEKDGTFHSENGMWSEGYVSALGQNTSSDERLKRIIRPIKLTVDEIAKAPIYVFEWINGAGIEIGSIAQYWHRYCQKVLGRARTAICPCRETSDWWLRSAMRAISVTMNI